MSPDSPSPSRQRKAWRLISALGAVLAAFSLLASVWLYTQQQSSREDTVRLACRESNMRHDQTIRQLNVIYLKRLNMLPPPESVPAAAVKRELDQALDSATPAQREQISNARAATITIIDQLSPKRDCDQRAVALTK